MKKRFTLLLAAGLFGLGLNSFAQTVYSQDFESATIPALPAGMSQISSATPGWVTNSGSVYWAIGYVNPHTKYVMVDDYNNDQANTGDSLQTTTFSLVGLPTPYLSFDYMYFQAHNTQTNTYEHALVKISTNGGTTWALLDTLGGVNDWQTAYYDLSAYGTYSNVKIEFVYSDGGGAVIGCALDNIKVFSALASDLQLTSVAPVAGNPSTDYFTTGSTATFSGTVFNASATPVTSYTVSYQAGVGTPVTSTISGTIAAFSSGTFTCATPYTVPAGTTPVKIWVSQTGDVDHTNDSMLTAVNGYANAVKKKIAIEEGTGSWCGYCVRGIVYMDSLWDLHSDKVSLVAVHDYNGYDPMAQENAMTMHYDTYISSLIGGYPSVVIDRRETADPQDLLTVFDNESTTTYGVADVSLGNVTYTPTSVTVPVTVKPGMNLTGDYRLELILTEDSVHGSAPGYLQHNYYSNFNQGGSAGPLTGQGLNYQLLPFAIPNVYYKFVDRSTTPDLSVSPTGVAGSLPATMTAGSSYSYTFNSINISSNWTAKHMRAVVFFIRNSDGVILNSANTIGTLGLANVEAGIEGVRLYPNPANQQANVEFTLKQDANVQVQITDMVGRIVYSVPAENMGTGDHLITLPTSALSSGVYNVKIQTENGIVTDRLTVIK